MAIRRTSSISSRSRPCSLPSWNLGVCPSSDSSSQEFDIVDALGDPNRQWRWETLLSHVAQLKTKGIAFADRKGRTFVNPSTDFTTAYLHEVSTILHSVERDDVNLLYERPEADLSLVKNRETIDPWSGGYPETNLFQVPGAPFDPFQSVKPWDSESDYCESS